MARSRPPQRVRAGGQLIGRRARRRERAVRVRTSVPGATSKPGHNNDVDADNPDEQRDYPGQATRPSTPPSRRGRVHRHRVSSSFRLLSLPRNAPRSIAVSTALYETALWITNDTDFFAFTTGKRTVLRKQGRRLGLHRLRGALDLVLKHERRARISTLDGKERAPGGGWRIAPSTADAGSDSRVRPGATNLTSSSNLREPTNTVSGPLANSSAADCRDSVPLGRPDCVLALDPIQSGRASASIDDGVVSVDVLWSDDPCDGLTQLILRRDANVSASVDEHHDRGFLRG